MDFRAFPLATGVLADLRSDPHPTLVRGWGAEELVFEEGATHFGYVAEGDATLITPSGEFVLRKGLYFSAPDGGKVRGGRGLLISRLGSRGLFTIGGPVEERGRLKYIDGSSDSLLISPTLRGDPCYNMVWIPKGTDQTAHTHPSHRVGYIVDGHVRCKTDGATIEFKRGDIFYLPANAMHAFHTDDESVRIMAYHPDSEYGPTHDEHPILNRTIVGGVDASKIEKIRTTNLDV